MFGGDIGMAGGHKRALSVSTQFQTENRLTLFLELLGALAVGWAR
jgi:hypothetical protein